MILFVMPVVLLFTLSALFCSMNPGQGRGELRGWKKIPGAIVTADMFILSGWHSSCSSRHAIFSPLMADPADTVERQQ